MGEEKINMEHQTHKRQQMNGVTEKIVTIVWILLRPFLRLYLRIVTAVFPFILWIVYLSRVTLAVFVGPLAAVAFAIALFISSFYTIWLALLVLCVRAAPVLSKLLHDTLLFLTDYGRKIWNMTLRPMFGKPFEGSSRPASQEIQGWHGNKPEEGTISASHRPEGFTESKDFVLNGSHDVMNGCGHADASPTHSTYSADLTAESSTQPQRRHRRTNTGSSSNRLSGTISPELVRTPLQMPSQNTSQERVRSRRKSNANSSPESYFRTIIPSGTDLNDYVLKHSRSGSSSTASMKSVGRISGNQVT